MLLTRNGVRKHSRRLVLEQISSRHEPSRQEIANTTGLSKPVVSSIVADLIEQGLVFETGPQSSGKGRPRVGLAFIPDARYLLGAEINNHECRTILTNLQAQPLRAANRSFPSDDLSPETMSNVLAECVEELVQGFDRERILGLGVSIPGVVDPTSGIVITSVIMPWHNVPFAEHLRRTVPYQTVIVSRGSAATWGERWYGAGRNIESMLYVRVGHGVVAGLVVEGKPYWGPRSGAGELGHMTVQPDGELCRCGNRGCLATVATVDALVMRVSQILREDMSNPLWEQLDHHIERLNFSMLVQAAAAGNQAAQRGFAEVAKWLAIAIASAIHLLDLQMIVIGGPIVEADSHFFDPLKMELAQRTMPTHLRNLKVVPSQLREQAPSLGAASLMLHELISSSRSSASRLEESIGDLS